MCRCLNTQFMTTIDQYVGPIRVTGPLDDQPSDTITLLCPSSPHHLHKGRMCLAMQLPHVWYIKFLILDFTPLTVSPLLMASYWKRNSLCCCLLHPTIPFAIIITADLPLAISLLILTWDEINLFCTYGQNTSDIVRTQSLQLWALSLCTQLPLLHWHTHDREGAKMWVWYITQLFRKAWHWAWNMAYNGTLTIDNGAWFGCL